VNVVNRGLAVPVAEGILAGDHEVERLDHLVGDLA